MGFEDLNKKPQDKKNLDEIDCPNLHSETTNAYGDLLKPVKDIDENEEKSGQHITAKEAIENLKKRNKKEDIESPKQELERKKAELKKEEESYRDNRSNPRKSKSDWDALDMSQNTRKKLEKEIEELEEKIEKM